MSTQGIPYVEALDIESPDQAVAYLQMTGLIAHNDEPRIEVLKGGVSNRTILVEVAGERPFVLKQALLKLRVGTNWFSDPMRIHREARGLRVLEEICPPGTITPLLFEDVSNHVIAMAAVPRPHENWKHKLLKEGPLENHVIQFAEILGHIQNESAHRKTVLSIFDDWTWFESLRLEPYYEYTASQVDEAAGFFVQLLLETRAVRLALVHGDYSPKNILIYRDQLVLIDHEVVHFGDPAFDVGFSLSHLLSKSLHCRQFREKFLKAAQTYITRYLDVVSDHGFDPTFESRATRHALGCMLARVAGRSPLEYLSLAERQQQRKIILDLIHRSPASLLGLIDEFEKDLNCR
jgi:5-methylthioribose kinase